MAEQKTGKAREQAAQRVDTLRRPHLTVRETPSAAGALLAGTPGVSSPGPGTPGAGAERVHSRRGVRGYDTTRCCPLWEGLGRKVAGGAGPRDAHPRVPSMRQQGPRQGGGTEDRAWTPGAVVSLPATSPRPRDPEAPVLGRGFDAEAGALRLYGLGGAGSGQSSSTCPPLLYSGPPGPAAGLMVLREPPGRTPCWGCQLRGGKGLHPRSEQEEPKSALALTTELGRGRGARRCWRLTFLCLFPACLPGLSPHQALHTCPHGC